MREKIRKTIYDTGGSSLVTVLVAFVILLIGIAGFYTSVTVSRDMINRAESLNNATGEVVKKFYTEVPYNEYTTNPMEFKVQDAEGNPVFGLWGAGKEATLTATSAPSPTTGETETITYEMYYYLSDGVTK